jgi:hypothetical protein
MLVSVWSTVVDCPGGSGLGLTRLTSCGPRLLVSVVDPRKFVISIVAFAVLVIKYERANVTFPHWDGDTIVSRSSQSVVVP